MSFLQLQLTSARACFQNCELLFDITRFFSIGYIGEVCSNFESIILILAGNENMHESLDEFKFRPDTDTNTRVICPCASEKLLYNVVTTLGPSFLIGSSSYLQVSRTSIISRTSSNFGQIRPRTGELAALERLKKIPIDL